MSNKIRNTVALTFTVVGLIYMLTALLDTFTSEYVKVILGVLLFITGLLICTDE